LRHSRTLAMFLGIVCAGFLGAMPATVTLAGTPNPAAFGQSATLTAAVHAGNRLW
jgi:hypothetical protein